MSDKIQAEFAPISNQELEWACKVMKLPRNAFGVEDECDPRLAVMRSFETLDIEACPGSGKTTLLVAKLAILANRWQSRRQGVCVLSHTNAARSEIGGRLSSTSAGHLLLRHPHFVGTIHSFVNEFFAIPWLRSRGRQIKVIDDNIAQEDRWRRLPWGIQRHLERQHEKPRLIYTQLNFAGNEFPAHTDTYKSIVKACQQSSEAGYYRFDEMFIWASELLDHFPDAIETIRRRFPLIFIDEVQDNSELQSAFLHRLFIAGERPIIRQRFGDSNQAIYNRSGSLGASTDVFPGQVKVDLPNSFRFGQAIADIAAPLGVRPQALVGRGPTTSKIKHTSCQSALLLFDDTSILNVLPTYAKYLIEVFQPEVLPLGDFTAVAGVHKAEKDDHLPRFMGHYAPGYDPGVTGRQAKPTSLAQYLARARLEFAVSSNIHPIANRCAEGILHFVRIAGGEVPIVLRKSAHRYLLEIFMDERPRQQYLALVNRLIDCRCEFLRDEWGHYVAPTAQAVGEAVLGRQVKEQNVVEFFGWVEVGAPDEVHDTPRKSTNLFHYPPGEPKVSIRLGSIHSVKGETHTATLVLECFQRAHHLEKLVRWLLGKKPKAGTDNSSEDQALIDRLKLHYVAMTRPSHLLCLAMRKDSFKPAELDLMRTRNWRVIECVGK